MAHCIYIVKTGVLISFVVTVKMICVFVFAYAKVRFYHDTAQIMLIYQLSFVMRKPAFAYEKTKTQISSTVTAKLISAFVFASRIGQSLYFLYAKFQASSHLVWLYSPVCVRPGRKPRRPVFSQRGSFYFRKKMCKKKS